MTETGDLMDLFGNIAEHYTAQRKMTMSSMNCCRFENLSRDMYNALHDLWDVDVNALSETERTGLRDSIHSAEGLVKWAKEEGLIE